MHPEWIDNVNKLKEYPIGTIIGGTLDCFVRTFEGWYDCTREMRCSHEYVFNKILLPRKPSNMKRVGVIFKPEPAIWD